MVDTEKYESWGPEELAEYLKVSAGLGQYYEMIVNHNISGKVAGRLTDNDLVQMIPVIGDRLLFQEAIESLQKIHRQKQRQEVIWNGEEMLFVSCCDRACGTCCGCCPADPSTYSLTHSHLTIKTVKTWRCGPIRCCCGHEYFVDNVDLTHVTSVDVQSKAPPFCQLVFCCGRTMEKVEIKTQVEGDKIITLEKDEGIYSFSKKILNQIEEAQQMERD
mmetsp:Transcript_16556/g.20611  ORF Transcript_16556/g.20611 Transcript_16556/m.20611 type:complete len:218 (-) Transcript_16556:155-808(-)